MNVYRLTPSHIVWSLHPDEDTDWDDFDVLDGGPLQETWMPIGVRFVSDQLNPSGPYPDVNIVGHVPVFSLRAVNHFANLLSGQDDALPMRCAEAELFALNVSIVDGAVDLEASDVVRFSSGRIMMIKKFAFNAAVLGARPIFRIAELPSQVFVNQNLVTRSLESSLAGFGANLVWSSENGKTSSMPAVPDASRPLAVEEVGLLDAQMLDEYLWFRTCEIAGTGRGNDLAAMSVGARAFFSTRLFEWEVSNGGLHQFFFNHPEPELIEAVAEGYAVFDVPEDAAVIRELVAPFADREAEWRESLRDGRIEKFFDSYPESQLDRYANRVGHHDIERLAYVRKHPENFVF